MGRLTEKGKIKLYLRKSYISVLPGSPGALQALLLTLTSEPKNTNKPKRKRKGKK